MPEFNIGDMDVVICYRDKNGIERSFTLSEVSEHIGFDYGVPHNVSHFSKDYSPAIVSITIKPKWR